MPLFLRPNCFANDTRADYPVIARNENGERVVGRIYSGAGLQGQQWIWALTGIGSDLAESLDDAKARLKVTLARLEH